MHILAYPRSQNVRILGPVRSSSQVEISATDARTLGIKAPTRQSGDTKGSAPIALVGPKGAIYLEEGCIVAARHIHLCPEDAAAAGLKDNDFVTVRMGNERGALLDNVKIRVDESFT
ncbi:MAG: propanediol utilization protein, partial [Selenomonadaceae bacterium]|nr:propanediol utilization protein [Selenomonadaceae bacterium]